VRKHSFRFIRQEVNMKSIKHRILNLGLAGVFSAASSFAAPLLPGFKVTDRNGDSMVSLEEFVAQGGHPQAFREGDGNADGRLNSDEYIKANANNDRIQAGKVASDAWITAKVKALLFKEDGVQGLDVNVETHNGMVQLAGWVDDAGQIARAEKITLAVEGVRGVRNDLRLKQ
jgi:hyperosmotically inducible protein